MNPPTPAKRPKRPVIFYYVLALAALMIFNAVVGPLLSSATTSQIDYGTFLTMLDEGKVSKVQIDEYQISLMASEDARTVYVTGRMEDPGLVERLRGAGVEFAQVIPVQPSPLISFLLTWVLPIGVMVLIGQWLTRSMSKRMGGNAMSFGKSNAKVYVAAQTGKTFADVAGQDEAKDALLEIVDFLHNPERYKEIGAVMPKGALLVGPPGTGKTLLAKAVAGEAKVPFFSISGSEFVEMFAGMGAARVRDLFQQAQQKAPCIVFIDEIDTIGKRRDVPGSIGGNDEREQTLNQLLTEMDGFSGEKGVVILAATNRPESLDNALLRPGRFDRRIPVDLPDLAGREAILRVHAQKVRVSPLLDFNAIARATVGASGADLANIVNEAALHAVKHQREYVLQSDLEESVEVVVAGYARKGAVISPEEKRTVAYHEIGHALTAALQSGTAPVHKITIVPRTSGALGYTLQVEEDEHRLMGREELLGRLVTLTGGRAAEEVGLGRCTSGASNDIEQATRLARAMVTRLGMSEHFGMMALETLANPYLGGDASLSCSAGTAAQIDQEVLTLLRQAHEQALALLREHTDALHALSARLLETETLNGEDFQHLLREHITAA